MASAEDASCPGEPGKVAPVVDRNRCEGKEDCVRVCPEACHACQLCVEACPERALSLAANR